MAQFMPRTAMALHRVTMLRRKKYYAAGCCSGRRCCLLGALMKGEMVLLTIPGTRYYLGHSLWYEHEKLEFMSFLDQNDFEIFPLGAIPYREHKNVKMKLMFSIS